MRATNAAIFDKFMADFHHAFDYLAKGSEPMAKLDENDTLIPFPECMLPDFDTGERIDPLLVGRCTPNGSPYFTPGAKLMHEAGWEPCEPDDDNDDCYLCSDDQREQFVSLLATRVARLVVSMTTGTCKCGKSSDACCQAT